MGISQIAFDENIVEQLEAAYRARDVLRRRELVYDVLEPQPGERILDVGCGPGFYVAELLDRVGPEGTVTGVDRSEAMLAVASSRTRAHGNVTFHEAEATALPVKDGEFDAALSVQVLEYVEDVPAVLAELSRALRPGGRVVVWDVDWSTLSWHSADPARMGRVLSAWDAHLADPVLPRRLRALLRDAGFQEVAGEGHVFVAHGLEEGAYVTAFLPLMKEYVLGSGLVPADEVSAWAAEQHELSARGEFFFACVQFCFAATRPA